MRVTAKAKRETQQRIIAAAQQLFASRGYGETSTRDLAQAAGIATGTLFNYFPTKEALAMSLIVAGLARGDEGYCERRHEAEDLCEDLFAHIAAGLRELQPYRLFIGEVIETALSPFGRASVTQQGEGVRVRHLERVAGILDQHGLRQTLGFVSIHLYWTLYLGVLAFWSKDDSPTQADTLVVLDESLQLYVASIERETLARARSSPG
ncbi:MAG: AcrR family transcriptional regulator [Chlamydiales bacterium]|jgi:AcrR family transcriptional regulator